MFRTVKRIINWCGEFKGRLYIGFFFSFFSSWFAAMPIILSAYMVGMLMDNIKNGKAFDTKWIGMSFLLILMFIILRFLFDYLRAKAQEPIGYELVAKNRLEMGDLLKRVSLGYFKKVNTGEILNAITTGLNTLETMGIRMVDDFVGGYLNFLFIFLWITVLSPICSIIMIVGVIVSFGFMLLISKYSRKNAPVATKANKNLTNATIEYARGLPVVKSFGQDGVSMEAMQKACGESRDINLKIEWGFVSPNCFHLLVLKIASVLLVLVSCSMGMSGTMSITNMLLICFLSFRVFGSVEPISDSAHVLGVIENAMNQLATLKAEEYIDEDGREIELKNYQIEFQDVSFGYDKRNVLNHVSFRIPERTSTAIVGFSGSGKTTICNLLARFYDVNSGKITIGGHNVKEFTCDSLLSNISMVFQNVYLFNDSIRSNICFGKPDATEAEMIEAAQKACCHEFIMGFSDGYDTIVGEGGGSLSGGEKQRISIARAILKDAPIIILDEATASIDPENEHLIQTAITELTKGKTIITIAHRLATIEQADQILVLDNGEIVERGTHRKLIQNGGVYQKFINIRGRTEGWTVG